MFADRYFDEIPPNAEDTIQHTAAKDFQAVQGLMKENILNKSVSTNLTLSCNSSLHPLTVS